MSRLVETIKIVDGMPCNVEYHLARLTESRKKLLGTSAPLDIESALLKQNIPTKGIYKCRILYWHHIEEIQIVPYILPKIHSLRLIDADEVEYSHKWEDRTVLKTLCDQKGNCDEILIVKNGFITDTSFSNIALYDGYRWITPSTYLLRGTKREKLIYEGILTEKLVRVEDIYAYKKASLINAMIDLGDVEVTVENIQR